MEQVDTGSSRTPLFSSGLAARTRAAAAEVDGTSIAYWVYEPVRVTPGQMHDPGGARVPRRPPRPAPGRRPADGHAPDHADLPGFGGSAAFEDTEHSVAAYGRFLSGFMAALGLGPDTVLLGHSFGSIIASHFVASTRAWPN